MTSLASPPRGVDLSYVDALPPWLTFDQFGRYSLLREALGAAREALGQRRLRVLDIGAYTRIITGGEALPVLHFLPDDDVLALDVVAADLPHYQQGNGSDLPFGDDAFDFVLSADTLEHVPPPERPAFIDQMLRVARLGVLLIAPMRAPATDLAEELLLAYIRAEHGVTHVQLGEHRAYGLPEVARVGAQLDAQGLPYQVYPSGYLHSWLAMMLAKFYLQKLTPDVDLHMGLDRYYIQFLAHDERREPSYRQAIVAAKRNQSDWLGAVEAALRPTVQPPGAPHSGDWQLVAGWLSQTVALRHATNGAAQQLVAAQQHAAQLGALLAQRDAQVADLAGRAEWYRQQAEAAQRELGRVANGRTMRLLRWLRGKQ
jgi:SAM-dependent methyltransferase